MSNTCICVCIWHIAYHITVPSGYPQNFQILPTSSRSIELQWEPPLIESKNGIITEYTIRQVTGDQDEYYATNATHFELTDLIPNTGYTFTIAASTSVGTGPYSPIVNVITPEDGKCMRC